MFWPWLVIKGVEVVIAGGGGFDECGCCWVSSSVANLLWLLVAVGKNI